MNEHLKDILQTLAEYFGLSREDVVVVHDETTGLLIASFPLVSSLAREEKEDFIHSLNIIVKKMTEKDTPLNWVLDYDGIYQKKLASARAKADVIASRVLSFKADIMLEPMNSFERLIFHAYLGKYPHIKTESHGQGEKRHIVAKFRRDSEIL